MIKIEVTQNDIDNGTRRSACKCPIALACKRALENEALWVTNEVKIYDNGHLKRWYLLPDAALEFIGDFDAGKNVSPITFEID